MFVDVFEVVVVERQGEGFRMFVVQGPYSVEEVVFEVAVVGQSARLVVEFSPSIHEVVFPLTFVASALRVGILAPSLTFVVEFVAFVAASVLEVIDGVDGLGRRRVLEGGRL